MRTTEISAQPNSRLGDLSLPGGRAKISVMPKRGPYRKAEKTPAFQRPSTQAKAWRLFRKMTVDEAATKAGLSNGQVTDLENGNSGYSPESLAALAKTYRITRGMLLDVDPYADQSEPLWKIWDRANDEQRAQLLEIAETIVKVAKPKR